MNKISQFLGLIILLVGLYGIFTIPLQASEALKEDVFLYNWLIITTIVFIGLGAFLLLDREVKEKRPENIK